MLYKKRWSDGLHNDFDHLDEFEAKFYCFGGDGGGSSGGGSSSNDTSDPDPAPAPPPSPSPSPPPPPRPSNPFQRPDTPATGFGLANVAPDAFASAPAAPAPVERPSIDVPVSFTPPDSSGISSLADFSDMSVDFGAPVNASQAYSQATSPNSDRTLSSLGQALGVDIPDRVNVAGYDVGFGPTPGSPGLAGVTVDLGPGTLGFGTNPRGDAVGLGYNMKFAKGGAVPQGIGSLMRRR